MNEFENEEFEDFGDDIDPNHDGSTEPENEGCFVDPLDPANQEYLGVGNPEEEEDVWAPFEADIAAHQAAIDNMEPGEIEFQGLDAPTKTRETEDRYIKVAERLIAKYEKEYPSPGSHFFNSKGFVYWLITQKSSWSKSTWRQYKSAVLFYLKSKLGDVRCLRAADDLEFESSRGCLEKATGTSAGRIKNSSEKEFGAFVKAIGKAPSKHHRFSGIARTWMLLGAHTGLRPHEWCQAVLIRNADETYEFMESHKLTPGKTYLRVRNSKNSNGRANGEYRHLDVTESTDAMLRGMEMLIAKFSDPKIYEAAYRNCRRLIADTNRFLFGNDATKRFHLYSARHRFASEAKKQFSAEFVAAAMGHATDQTAFSLYGNSRHSSGGRIAKPVEGEAATVKQRSGRRKAFLESRKTSSAIRND